MSKILLFVIVSLGMSQKLLLSQSLAYKQDSMFFRNSKIVELEEGGRDTVSISRYHQYIWFQDGSETAANLNSQLYRDMAELPVRNDKELREYYKNDYENWFSEWEMQFIAEDSSPINYSFGLNWYEEIYTGVSQQSANTICLYQSTDGFYGGAHPIGGTQYMVFELPGANRIKNWQELFTDTVAVLKMAEDIFRKDRNLSSKTPLNEAGYWFNNDKFHLTDNFGLNAEGIFSLFNQYEIASYAEGPIYISIPQARIKKYLKNPS